MKVSVRFFASLRDVTRVGEQGFDLPAGASFDALCAQLEARFGAEAVARLREPTVRVARNQTLETPPFLLADGDEIAFLPPVTGG